MSTKPPPASDDVIRRRGNIAAAIVWGVILLAIGHYVYNMKTGAPDKDCVEAAGKLLTSGRHHFPSQYERAIAEHDYWDLRDDLAWKLESRDASCYLMATWERDREEMVAAALMAIQWLPHN